MAMIENYVLRAADDTDARMEITDHRLAGTPEDPDEGVVEFVIKKNEPLVSDDEPVALLLKRPELEELHNALTVLLTRDLPTV